MRSSHARPLPRLAIKPQPTSAIQYCKVLHQGSIPPMQDVLLYSIVKGLDVVLLGIPLIPQELRVHLHGTKENKGSQK